MMKWEIHFVFRLYRACGWRTSVCSLLTGALLEATVAVGARSPLPLPLLQCPNNHAVLKGGFYVVCALLLLG